MISLNCSHDIVNGSTSHFSLIALKAKLQSSESIFWLKVLRQDTLHFSLSLVEDEEARVLIYEHEFLRHRI